MKRISRTVQPHSQHLLSRQHNKGDSVRRNAHKNVIQGKKRVNHYRISETCPKLNIRCQTLDQENKIFVRRGQNNWQRPLRPRSKSVASPAELLLQGARQPHREPEACMCCPLSLAPSRRGCTHATRARARPQKQTELYPDPDIADAEKKVSQRTTQQRHTKNDNLPHAASKHSAHYS